MTHENSRKRVGKNVSIIVWDTRPPTWEFVPQGVLGRRGLEPVIGFRPQVRLNYELNEGREDGV